MILKTPFKLGSLQLPSNIFYAPLAGCSDFPFRQMAARYRPGLMYCEMVKMDPLVRNDEGTLKMLDYEEAMRPIGAQICGSKVQMAGQSAKIIESLGFDVVDLNCGCPVDKVTKDGSGSGLLKDPERIGELVANMVAAVDIPVTVKVRAGWDESAIVAPQIAQIVAAAGASALCIHGRTREQGYRGPANWDWIKLCKEAAPNLTIIGNGDLFSPEAVESMFLKTGCDAFLVSRGTMGQPWIVEDIIRHFEGEECLVRDHAMRCQALRDHFELALTYFPERKALLDMRRICSWYIKSTFGARSFRDGMHKSQSVDEIMQLLQQLV